MIATYDIGDVVRLAVALTQSGTGAIDPTGLTLKVKTPNAAVTTYTYGVDQILVRDALGKYHLDWPAAATGTHNYRWAATGVGAGAEEGSFVVRVSGVI